MHALEQLNRYRLTIHVPVFVLIGMALSGPGALNASEPPRVRTDKGPVQGIMDGSIESYRGLRYAKAPVDSRRWEPPVPVEPWTGIHDASEFGAACPQPGETGYAPVEVPTNEDCLFLNVWTPDSGDQQHPVMVWFHGGGHRFGAGSMDFYNGRALAARGAVVVTVNYRLGMLGYFAHPAINPDGTGNFGLLDEIAALKWVRDNIAAFGGNPDNVTVFGESAGAVDIQHLMAIESSHELFDKAILQSGGGWATTKSRSAQRELVDEVIEHIELDEVTGERLRRVSPNRLVDALSAVSGGLGFGPFIDGTLVERSPKEAFAAGDTAPVPMMVGSNDWEGSLLKLVDLGPKQQAVVRMPGVRSLYEGQFESDRELESLLFGDIGFVAPARWLAKQQSNHARTYLYHFTYVAERMRAARPGVAHGSEIPYVFATLESGDELAKVASREDHRMAAMVADCWVAFAADGKPDCGLGEWPAYSAETDPTMLIAEDPGVVEGFRATTLDALTRFFGPGGVFGR